MKRFNAKRPRARSRSGEMSGIEKEQHLRAYYQALYAAWGPQNWWPAQSKLEMIVGAYLTQNTAWTNVEKALTNLRSARLLNIEGLRKLPLDELEQLIRPSGYFRQKAKKLKLFIEYLDSFHAGSLTRMFTAPTAKLRKELLDLNGVGPETADSILLYAGGHAVFVVDAYTRRILERHGIASEEAKYEELRELFEASLAPLAEREQELSLTSAEPLATGFPPAPHPVSKMSAAKRTALTQIYNEMHGLIVGVGKNFCKKSHPLCDGCPLQRFLPRVK